MLCLLQHRSGEGVGLHQVHGGGQPVLLLRCAVTVVACMLQDACLAGVCCFTYARLCVHCTPAIFDCYLQCAVLGLG